MNYFFDTFHNFLSGLGVPGRDKLTGSQYVAPVWTREQLETSFRSDWIARKAITIPAFDATRQWRAWQAKQPQIEKLEETEQRLGVQLKLQQALVKARLYGGCCMMIGVEGNTEKELDPDDIKKDGLKFIHILAPHQIGIEELIKDIEDPYYGQPTKYILRDETKKFGDVKIHPSRMVRLIGNDPPDPMQNSGWGDPLLQMIHDAVNAAGTVSGSIATLISEAKLDVIKIPGLTEIFSTTNGTNRLIKRFTEANVAKSVINGIIMDAEEEWERIGVNFAGMPEILQLYLQIAAGAADIPMTRFAGMSPAGLNATGESDLQNYYDRIKSDQELRLTPALEKLDKAIVRSALGKADDNIFYEWNSLWQMTEADKATVAKQKADSTMVDVNTGLIPPEALAKGRINQLIEDGTYPGLEAAIEEALAAQEQLAEEEEQKLLMPPGRGSWMNEEGGGGEAEGMGSGPPGSQKPKAGVARDSVGPFGLKKQLRMQLLHRFGDAIDIERVIQRVLDKWNEEDHQRDDNGGGGAERGREGSRSALRADGVRDEGNEIEEGDGQGGFDDLDDAGRWDEAKHPRGQPENKGQFGPGGGGSAKSKTKRAVSSAANLVSRARASGRSIAEQHEYETSKRPAAKAQHARVKGKETEKVSSAALRAKAAELRQQGAETEAAELERAAKGKKKPAKIEDFEKAQIRVSIGSTEQERFLKQWDERVGMDPEEFKNEFLGGVRSTMTISTMGSTRIDVAGSLMTEDGKNIGSFNREIDFENNKAYSAYFKVEKAHQGDDTGKRVLAGNVAMYEKLGITEVGVTANIDVGGYAWAKYGYVPTQDAWNSTRQRLASEIAGGGSSSESRTSRGENTWEAEEWAQLDDVAQADVRDRWMRESHDEFFQSEVDSWRDSGQALEDAKRSLQNDYRDGNFTPDWMNETLNEMRDARKEEGLPDIPYSNQQIYAALTIEDYESRSGEGRDDPEFVWDDTKLQKPDPKISGYDPDQLTIPGIEPLDPATYMTEEMRETINDRMVDAFNSKADNDSQYADAPEYLNDSVSEYQEQFWEDMDDREHLRIAERYDMHHVPKPEPEEEEEDEELELEKPKVEEKPAPKEGEKPRRTLEEIVKDANPKAMWEFADAPGGKDLLLKLSKAGYGWRGKLNLKDPESYKRFKEYVGRVKEKKRAA